MPNWCYNYLDISGDETLIADIKRQLNKPFVKTHDSWNATTGNMELSQTQYSNPPDTELYEDTDNSLGYKFNTAWSPPIEAITKLSEQYPSLEMNLSYEEETGWGGEVTLLNGFITTVEEYDNKCRDCDSLNTLEYCENDCGEICSACNYMGEADLDCVADCDVHKIYLTEEFVPDYRLEKQ